MTRVFEVGVRSGGHPSSDSSKDMCASWQGTVHSRRTAHYLAISDSEIDNR